MFSSSVRFFWTLFILCFALASCSESSFNSDSNKKKPARPDLNKDAAKETPKPENQASENPDKEQPTDQDADAAGEETPKPDADAAEVGTPEADVDADESEETKFRKPEFAMLVNDLECGLCHVAIDGNVLSTSEVPHLRDDSRASVAGAWLAAENFVPKWLVRVTAGVKEFYEGNEMPKDLNQDGKPDFPEFTSAEISKIAKGELTAVDHNGAAVSIKGTTKGDTVMIGSEASPIVISGEILIEGNLVIKGAYKGIGTIYATGNIYVPGNLVALNSAFPIKEGEDAKGKMKHDALGIASKKSVLVGDIRSAAEKNNIGRFIPGSIFESPETPPEQSYEFLEVDSIYQTVPLAEYQKLYDMTASCRAGSKEIGFDRIDAYIYAGKSVAGVTRSVYSINGGIMSDSFHIISGAMQCRKMSAINFDYRLKEGLPILQGLAKYFERTDKK